MSKQVIFITGATDGIGKLSAKQLAAQGHTLLVHGRNPSKLEALTAELGAPCEPYIADLSKLEEVEAMARQILDRHQRLDVLINNAGVLKAPQTRTASGLDLRIVVNTLAPWVLTQRLLPIIPDQGRIVNLSSAAQAPINLQVMHGRVQVDDMSAYAQSKLAITIWSRELAKQRPQGPVVIALNPGSLLASKMVKEGFGVAGKDLSIGANIMCKAALDPAFAEASGQYFDNDSGRFAQPHAAALNPQHAADVMRTIEELTASSPN